MAQISSYKQDILNVFSQNLPWERLSSCNILITGSTGLIGSCFVEVLMTNPHRDYNVYAAGRNKERADKRFSQYARENGFFFIQYDVTKPISLDVNFDYIIHAASNASPNFFAKKPVEVMMSNILGVDNLLKYGLNHNLKRFLYVSSGEIYGEGDGNSFTENYSGYVNPMKSRSCYPSSKRAAETLCISYSDEYGIDIVVARPSHVYGPYFTESDNRVYAQFIQNVLDNKDIIMKSSGSQYRSWCYVVDCISGLLFILLKGHKGEAYNIADKNSNLTIKELANMVANIGKKHVVMKIQSSEENKGFNPVTKSLFDTTKIEGLGWNIKGDMKIKMTNTINERYMSEISENIIMNDLKSQH
jgi:nucleoside-diphosphate-sugar epimerase